MSPDGGKVKELGAEPDGKESGVVGRSSCQLVARGGVRVEEGPKGESKVSSGGPLGHDHFLGARRLDGPDGGDGCGGRAGEVVLVVKGAKVVGFLDNVFRVGVIDTQRVVDGRVDEVDAKVGEEVGLDVEEGGLEEGRVYYF